jgi:hypothetical protein
VGFSFAKVKNKKIDANVSHERQKQSMWNGIATAKICSQHDVRTIL